MENHDAAMRRLNKKSRLLTYEIALMLIFLSGFIVSIFSGAHEEEMFCMGGIIALAIAGWIKREGE